MYLIRYDCYWCYFAALTLQFAWHVTVSSTVHFVKPFLYL